MEKRKCKVCGELKAETEFPWQNRSKGTRKLLCKVCYKERDKGYSRKYYLANKRKYIENARKWHVKNREAKRDFVYSYLLKHPCTDCGETDPVVLDFDHVRGKKEECISTMLGRSYSLSCLKAEVVKCEIRCRNCHQRKTARERSYWMIERSPYY